MAVSFDKIPSHFMDQTTNLGKFAKLEAWNGSLTAGSSALADAPAQACLPPLSVLSNEKRMSMEPAAMVADQCVSQQKQDH